MMGQTMQFLVSLLLCIALGYRAKQRGRDGFKFAAGVALVLFGSSALLGFWDQATGDVQPFLWWAIAVFTVVMAWMRLEGSAAKNPNNKVEAAPSSTAAPTPQPAHAAVVTPPPTKEKWSEKLLGIVGIIIMIFALVQGFKWITDSNDTQQTPSAGVIGGQLAAATSGKFFVAPAKLSPEDMGRLTETKMPDGMPLNAWAAQGFGYSDRTRIFLWANNFGSIDKINVDQLGVLTNTGQIHHIPRFALKYGLIQKDGHDVLMFVSMNGAGNSVRVTFDDSKDYVELLPTDGDFVRLRTSDSRLKLAATAKKMKVLHAVSANGQETSLTYDLEELRNAAAGALATLGSNHSLARAANIPPAPTSAPTANAATSPSALLENPRSALAEPENASGQMRAATNDLGSKCLDAKVADYRAEMKRRGMNDDDVLIKHDVLEEWTTACATKPAPMQRSTSP